MKYEYRCSHHGLFRSNTHADHLECPEEGCFFVGQRQWGVNISAPFQPHFNPTLGVAVNSQSQFNSELSRASEAASAPTTLYDSTGQPHLIERPHHNFVPVDARYKTALGVTNDGLDATYDRWKGMGRDDDAKKLKQLMDE